MTGTANLLLFSLRRERRSLPWWLLGAAVLLLVQSTRSQNLYSTAEDLANPGARSAGTPLSWR